MSSMLTPFHSTILTSSTGQTTTTTVPILLEFHFKWPSLKRKDKKIEIDVKKWYQHPQKTLIDLMGTHQIPGYLEIPLMTTIETLLSSWLMVRKENMNENYLNALNDTVFLKKRLRERLEWYEKTNGIDLALSNVCSRGGVGSGTTANVSDVSSKSDISFHAAFQQLLSQPQFDNLLLCVKRDELELTHLIENNKQIVTDLKISQRQELSSVEGDDSKTSIQELQKRHLEEIKLLNQTLYHETINLKTKQKSRFQEMVVHVDRIPSKTILETEIKEKTNELSVMSSKKTDDPMVLEILQMGFSVAQGKAALEMTARNLENALNLILENPNRVEQYIKDQEMAPRKRKSTTTLHNKSLSRLGSSTRNTPSQSPGQTRRLFSPMNILANAVNKKEDNPAFRTMSNFLGKAMEALGIEDSDDDEVKFSGEEEFIVDNTLNFSEMTSPVLQSPGTDALSETFTAYCGAHTKTMYNIRLVVSDLFQLFVPKRARDPLMEAAIKAQDANTLYKHQLQGVILLLKEKDLDHYLSTEKSVNKDWIEWARRTTEYHFDDIDTQWKNALAQKQQHNKRVKGGDVIVTKHSNIPMAQVLFHLIIEDGDELQELNTQSNTSKGYRNILSIAHKCDVYHLTIPMPLSSGIANINTTQLLVKRAEWVLKSTRAMLNEWNHSNTHTGFNYTADQHARSIQFVLPELPPHLPKETVFSAVKDKIMEIFRATI